MFANGLGVSQLSYLGLYVVLYIAVGFQNVSNMKGDLHIWEYNLLIWWRLWRKNERASCILSTALSCEESVRSPGILPGKVRETRLSRWYQSTVLHIQMTVAAEDRSSDITRSIPHFSSILPSVTLGFQRLASIYFIDTWGKNCTGRDCLQFLVICVPCKTERSFLVVAEESNTTAVVLCTELD